MGVEILFVVVGAIYFIFHFLFISGPKIQLVQLFTFHSTEEKKKLHQFYIEKFPFYTLLEAKEKKKFLVRVINIRELNQLKISSEISHSKNDVELLICAAFTQITFGYFDYEISAFSKVVVNPSTFYSKLVKNQVKGLTIGTGYIFYSWEDFLSGYENEKDKVNLALHELAHALYIDRFHDTENEDWHFWKYQAKKTLSNMNSNEPTIFRTYGKTNINEFWAVTVECFFEDPISLKQQYPHLYTATCLILKQDMEKRIKQRATTDLLNA